MKSFAKQINTLLVAGFLISEISFGARGVDLPKDEGGHSRVDPSNRQGLDEAGKNADQGGSGVVKAIQKAKEAPGESLVKSSDKTAVEAYLSAKYPNLLGSLDAITLEGAKYSKPRTEQIKLFVARALARVDERTKLPASDKNKITLNPNMKVEDQVNFLADLIAAKDVVGKELRLGEMITDAALDDLAKSLDGVTPEAAKNMSAIAEKAADEALLLAQAKASCAKGNCSIEMSNAMATNPKKLPKERLAEAQNLLMQHEVEPYLASALPARPLLAENATTAQKAQHEAELLKYEEEVRKIREEAENCPR